MQSWKGKTVVLLVAVCSLLCLRDMSKANNLSDVAPVWVGSRAILAGQNPYSPATTQQIQRVYFAGEGTPDRPANPMTFAYPAPVAILFAPLAVLPWPLAGRVFLLAAILLSALSIGSWFSVIGFGESTREKLVAGALALFSWPMVWAIGLKQPTVIIAALLAFGSWLLMRRRCLSSGICFALCLVKPQIGVPIVAWLSFWSIVNRRWALFFSLSGTTIVLLAATEALLPGWFLLWLHAVSDFASYRHLDSVVGRPVTACIVIAVSWLLLKKMRTDTDRSFAESIALVLASAVVIMPTEPLMMYNNVLLLPAVLLLARARTEGATAGAARAMALIMWQISFVTVPIGLTTRFWWYPGQAFSPIPFRLPLLAPCTLLALWLAIYASEAADPQPLAAGVMSTAVE